MPGVAVVGEDVAFVVIEPVFGEGQHQRITGALTGVVGRADVEIASVGQGAEKRLGVVVRKIAAYGHGPVAPAVVALRLPEIAVVGRGRIPEKAVQRAVGMLEQLAFAQ